MSNQDTVKSSAMARWGRKTTDGSVASASAPDSTMLPHHGLMVQNAEPEEA